MKTFVARLSVVALTTLATACTNGVREAQRAGATLVTGTVLDAATGEPAAGVRVEGPGGASARSDEHGRFQMRGIVAGTEGDLVAAADDGRRASVRLRPLTSAPVEVVLQLRVEPAPRGR